MVNRQISKPKAANIYQSRSTQLDHTNGNSKAFVVNLGGRNF